MHLGGSVRRTYIKGGRRRARINIPIRCNYKNRRVIRITVRLSDTERRRAFVHRACQQWCGNNRREPYTATASATRWDPIPPPDRSLIKTDVCPPHVTVRPVVSAVCPSSVGFNRRSQTLLPMLMLRTTVLAVVCVLSRNPKTVTSHRRVSAFRRRRPVRFLNSVHEGTIANGNRCRNNKRSGDKIITAKSRHVERGLS